MIVNWTLEVNTDDGYVIFESKARIECELGYDDGIAFVEVHGFEIDAARRSYDDYRIWESRKEPAVFSPESENVWMKMLYLHVKEQLEDDPEFIGHAEELDGRADEHLGFDHRASQRLLACELI